MILLFGRPQIDIINLTEESISVPSSVRERADSTTAMKQDRCPVEWVHVLVCSSTLIYGGPSES